MEKWLSDNWLKVVAILMLAGAFYPALPYAYYQLLDWVVAGAALMTSLQARESKQMLPVWLYAFVMVVFNPIAPLYLRADIWQLTDIVAALLMAIAIFWVRSPKK